MTITRIPLLIICLFALFSVTGCDQNGNIDLSNPWTTQPQSTPANSGAATQTAIPPNTAPSVNRAPNRFENLPPVTVAILLPLSGPKGAIGKSMLQAAQLALFDIGYTKFNLIPRDTQGTASGAAAAANEAIKDGAQIILGPLLAESVIAVKKVAGPRSINVIAFSTDWSLADHSTFMMGFMPFSQVDRVTQYAAKNGYKNFAVVAPNDAYGDAVTDRFQSMLQQAGGSVSQSIRFAPGDPAVINQIATLPKTDASFQAVFMPVGGSQIETISSALSYNKYMPSQIKRVGTGLWDDPRIAQLPNMQGAWYAGPSPQARANFEKQYYNTYGQRPVRLGTLAYDATALAAVLALEGFQKNGKPAFDYAALTNPNGFSGTDGVFRFRSNGLVERALSVLELRDGRLVEIDPAPKRF